MLLTWLAASWLGLAPLAAHEVGAAGVVPFSGTWRLFAPEAGDEPTDGSVRLADAAPAATFAAADVDTSSWQVVTMPGTWAELGLAGFDGAFWLRKPVLLPADWRSTLAPTGLALALGPSNGGSYTVWINGELVASSPGGLLPVPEPRVFSIPDSAIADQLHVAIRFDRHAWEADGEVGAMSPFASLELGDLHLLSQQRELRELRLRDGSRIPELLALLFLVAGSYHLLLWTRRRMLRDHLWFALLSLDVALMTLVTAPPVSFTESLVLARRLTLAMEHLSVLLLIQFLWTLLTVARPRWLRLYQYGHGAFAVLVLVLPWPWIAWMTIPRQLYVIPFIVAVSHLVAIESWRRSAYARILAPGTAAVLVSTTAEMMLQMFDRGTTFPLPVWAFAFFTLSMVFALSSRHTRERSELEELRLQLERMVDDRTTELRHANERLQAEIAERHLAEEAMRMLERAVEQSIDGIAVADLEGNMQFINEAWARMHGYEVFELLGYDLNIFHTSEQMTSQVLPLVEKVRAKGSHEAEIEHRRRGGETFPTWMTATFLQDSEGSSSGIVFIARDIAERKRTEQERLRLEGRVKQAEKLESLGSLAGGIAHDYNNILTGVLGNASLLLQELPTETMLRDRVRQIEISAERAAELTDQLLAYAGEEQNVTRVFSLNDLIREQKAAFEAAMPSNAKLELHLKRELPPVDADPAQITQAILNLLTNAGDSLLDEDGVVMLRTSVINAKRSYFDGALLDEGQAEGRYVFFEVSDSGCGMDEATQKKMFDPFFSTKATGRGLGLAAVLGIARAHSGVIKVYSQPGRGTTIEVLFPVHRVALPEREESGIFRLWKGTGTALVVDDEELVREVAVKILERQGFEVLKASDGPEALEIFERRRDDIRLVLLDLTMPQMDGETVFREIRRHDTDVRVLLMSGYREKSATQGLEGEGLAGFLHKPFRPNELVRKVREVLIEPD